MDFPAPLLTSIVLATTVAHGQTAPTPRPAAVVVDPLNAADAHAARLAPAGSVLERRAVLAAASGTVVRYVQRHRGVLVRDGGAAVLVSPAGAVLASNDFTARALPAATPVVLDARAAAAVARARVGGSDPGDDAQRTFLVWTRERGAPRLVYECDLAPLEHADADAPRVLVDPASGRVLLRQNRARSFRARVFRANPVRTPMTEEVDLPGLPEGSDTLRGTDVESFTCIDDHRLYRAGGTRVHLCSPIQSAHPDARGLFAFATDTPNAVDDPYAELSMYYHATSHVAFVRTLGLRNLRTRPLRTVSNVRFPFELDPAEQSNPNGMLLPWNNAAFVPGTPPNALADIYGSGRDVLVFGQGESVDFAHDGDVVAHEVGHAVVASTADFGDEVLDEWGTEVAPRALNEALADYFSAARAEDPRVGEYAGSSDWSGGEIRNLAVEARYPDTLRGEAHFDSVPFSAALWALRERLGASFDRVVYEALTMAPVDPRNDTLAEQVIAAARRVLGEEAGSAASALFAARGILPRGPRVLVLPAHRDAYFMLPGVEGSDLPYVPGYLQFRVPASSGAYQLNFDIPVHTRDPVVLRVLVRAGEAVRFRYPSSGAIEADALAETTVEARFGRARAALTFPPLATESTLYVALGVEDGMPAWAGPVSLGVQRQSPPSDAGVPVRDAGAPRPTPPRFDAAGGCTVAPGSRAPARAPLAPLALAAVALAHRLRARRRGLR
jgi:hypothetical protein